MNKSRKIKKETNRAKVYICDPEKQLDCKMRYDKTWCGKECFCTHDIKKAKDTKPLTRSEYESEYKRRNT